MKWLLILLFNLISTSFASESPVKFIPLKGGVEKYVGQFTTPMEVTGFNQDEEIFDANMEKFSTLSSQEFGIDERSHQRQFVFDTLFMNEDAFTQKYSHLKKEKLIEFKSQTVKAFIK